MGALTEAFRQTDDDSSSSSSDDAETEGPTATVIRQTRNNSLIVECIHMFLYIQTELIQR